MAGEPAKPRVAGGVGNWPPYQLPKRVGSAQNEHGYRAMTVQGWTAQMVQGMRSSFAATETVRSMCCRLCLGISKDRMRGPRLSNGFFMKAVMQTQRPFHTRLSSRSLRFAAVVKNVGNVGVRAATAHVRCSGAVLGMAETPSSSSASQMET